VTHHANSIAAALYINKFESSETPTRTGTVSANCSIFCRSARPYSDGGAGWGRDKSHDAK